MITVIVNRSKYGFKRILTEMVIGGWRNIARVRNCHYITIFYSHFSLEHVLSCCLGYKYAILSYYNPISRSLIELPGQLKRAREGVKKQSWNPSVKGVGGECTPLTDGFHDWVSSPPSQFYLIQALRRGWSRWRYLREVWANWGASTPTPSPATPAISKRKVADAICPLSCKLSWKQNIAIGFCWILVFFLLQEHSSDRN